MTLVLSVGGEKTIWLLADRRLSAPGQDPIDDARKIFALEADGGAGGDQVMLGYAGLGRTRGGMEPSEWMASVLRNRHGSIEQYLRALAAAAGRQLPRHVDQHVALGHAIVEQQIRLYAITIGKKRGSSQDAGFVTRIERRGVGGGRYTPRLAFAGSGASFLESIRREWARPLMRMVNAHERGRLAAYAVADHLAAIGLRVHRESEPDLSSERRSVGPRSLVVWRTPHGPAGHSGQAAYTEGLRDRATPLIPSIANGMHVQSLIEGVRPHSLEMYRRFRAGDKRMVDFNPDLLRRTNLPADETLK